MNDPGKAYNVQKAMELQHPQRKRSENTDHCIEELEEGNWEAEAEERRRQKMKVYKQSLSALIRRTMESPSGELTLSALKKSLESEPEDRRDEEQRLIIPGVTVFKQVILGLLSGQSIDIRELSEERKKDFVDAGDQISINEALLLAADDMDVKIDRIECYRIEDGHDICFENVPDSDQRLRTIRCSNVLLRVICGSRT